MTYCVVLGPYFLIYRASLLTNWTLTILLILSKKFVPRNLGSTNYFSGPLRFRFLGFHSLFWGFIAGNLAVIA